eukprot:3493770-Pyramimonas_sp.AAC.1
MVGIYLYGDQSQTGTEANECIPVYGYRSQGSQRVYTCMVVTTNHRGASGYIPVWIPITGEPAGDVLGRIRQRALLIGPDTDTVELTYVGSVGGITGRFSPRTNRTQVSRVDSHHGPSIGHRNHGYILTTDLQSDTGIAGRFSPRTFNWTQESR